MYNFFELFNSSLTNPFTKSIIYQDFNLKPLTKARPSHGSGEVHGNKLTGIKLITYAPRLKTHLINSILLYGLNHRGIQVFKEKLPLGLEFSMSRQEVIKLLGVPDWSIKAGGLGIWTTEYSADKWFVESGEGVRVEYSTDLNSIRLIIIASSEQEAEWRG